MKPPVSIHLQMIIEKAKALALSRGRNGVDMDILFYAFMTFPAFSMVSIFSRMDIEPNTLQELAYEEVKNLKPSNNPSDHLTPKAKNFLEVASQFCTDQFDLDYVATEIAFLCFFSEVFLPKAAKIYFSANNEKEILKDARIVDLFEKTAVHSRDMENLLEEEGGEDQSEPEQESLLDMFETNPVLGEFAENMNALAAKGKFDKIVDFDNKIDELASVLCRKKKPNAILIGPAGCGKTSIIESLALKIVRGEAPELLSNKVIYSVNLSSMVAGTLYRGQFEQRLQNFVTEAKKYSNLILFLDEIHTLVGAGGSSSNSLEASNILKPELARGTISCIGATTVNEYTNTIKKDSALDRRFERVIIREPSKFIMLEILPEIISHYEDFHGVSYSPEFISNVIDYCERFIPNRFYPDKAVTVIDHCGAQAKINFWEADESVREKQREIISHMEVNGEINPKLFAELNKRLENWKTKLEGQEPVVSLSHLKNFFEKRRNPMDVSSVQDSVFSLLKREIVGQGKALKTFRDSIVTSSFGMIEKESFSKPDCFLFYGKGSVGKSVFCRSLKDSLEKNGVTVLAYNGVQLSDQFASYKILSDFNNNTSLAEKVVMHPNSVIIIDDFHKVNPSCSSLFVQILKEGKLQMSNGDTADFSNCKFVFTSGIGSSFMGFEVDSLPTFSPDINKDILDFILFQIRFAELVEKDLRRIFWNRLKKIQKNLLLKNVTLIFNFEYIKKFVSKNKGVENNMSKFNECMDKEISESIIKRILRGEEAIVLE